MPPIVNTTIQGTRIKPATALIAPITPRSLAPTHTVIPTMWGPGISWEKVRVSANSCSSIQCCCSTTARRAQTSPPPKPLSETLRKPTNRSLSGTRSPEPLVSDLSSMAPPRRLWPIGSASGADTSRLVRYRAGSIETKNRAAFEKLREQAVKSASIARACCGRWPVERRCRAGLGARRRTRSHGYRAEGYNFYPAGRSQSRRARRSADFGPVRAGRRQTTDFDLHDQGRGLFRSRRRSENRCGRKNRKNHRHRRAQRCGGSEGGDGKGEDLARGGRRCGREGEFRVPRSQHLS